MKETVAEVTVKQGLCTSCGICSVVCPKGCIEYHLKKGQYLPQINKIECIMCGKCAAVCANHTSDFEDIPKELELSKEIYVGEVKSIYNLVSKNKEILKSATSGGAITTIVDELLKANIYDCAFLVDSFQYDHFVTTNPFFSGDYLEKSQKSRYIPVSHEKMARYALDNPEKKIIVVATSCVIHTFKRFIAMNRLKREQFLFLGLFCDRTLNYNIFEYFKKFKDGKNSLKKLYFRTKEESGWPGNIKLEYLDGSYQFLEAEERMAVKDYFQLERCLYCLDKLNRDADLSFGDNYTGDDQDQKAGESTVIIRTELGVKIFKKFEKAFFTNKINEEILKKSQHLDMRKENSINIKIKLGKNDLDKKRIQRYSDKIRKIELGKNYLEKKEDLEKQLLLLKKQQKVNRFKSKIKGLLKF